MSSLGGLRTSLAWQEHVAMMSRDPDQRERARKAIERLKAEIETKERESA